MATLHAKNNFAFALIVGELFARAEAAPADDNDQLGRLLSGQIEVPLPTYFALGRRILPNQVLERLRSNSGELCPNLFFLGRRTTTKTSEGIKIVALGGAFQGDVLDDKTSLNEYSPVHTDGDVKILKGANSADILVTAEWPAEIRTGSKVVFAQDQQPVAQQSAADLCSLLKPRYHFSTSDAFFEREPFFHPREEESGDYRITRFISLAPYGNAARQKWIYAFSLDPKAPSVPTVPAGTTASPISLNARKRKAPASAETQSYSRFATGSNSNSNNNHPRRNKRARQPPPTPQECFFCLSNPNIASHLITSIGDSAYLTTAKGPLSAADTYPSLDFPGHMLVIPLEHAPTLDLIRDPEARTTTVTEMERYRLALQRMLSSRSRTGTGGKDGKEGLGAVTWEISRAGGIHVHWQFLPVPRDMIMRGLVEAAFKVEAENEKYPAFDILSAAANGNTNVKTEDGTSTASVEGDYFKATIWAEDVGDRVMVLRLDASFRFDLQFGRRVLAKLLGLEARLDWRDCGQSEIEETAEAEAFKAAFKDFDFSLEE